MYDNIAMVNEEFSLLLQKVTLSLNPFTPIDRFSSIQNSEWKSPLKLLSVEMKG